MAFSHDHPQFQNMNTVSIGSLYPQAVIFSYVFSNTTLLHKTFYNFLFLTVKIYCIIVLLLGVTNYSFSYHLLLKILSTRYGHEIQWKTIYIIFLEMLIREWLISPKEAGKSQFTASLKNHLELYIVLITSPECGNTKLMLLWLP